MGKIIRDNNYEILPGLRALLASEHFYDECIIGTMVKNPIDFILNPINQFSASLPIDNVQKVNFNSRQIYPNSRDADGHFYGTISCWMAAILSRAFILPIVAKCHITSIQKKHLLIYWHQIITNLAILEFY